MVHYYAWYSNRSMGQWWKEGMLRYGDTPPEKEDSVDFTILDVSDYDPPRVPSQFRRIAELDGKRPPQRGQGWREVKDLEGAYQKGLGG